MLEKQKIVIAAFINGKAKRQIAREEKLDIKTVRRYIDKHEKDLDKIRTAKDIGEVRILANSIVEQPKYDTSSRGPVKLSEEMRDRIDELFALNKERRLQGMYKQQMRKIDIYELLQSEGHKISYTTVCNRIRSILSGGKEAFIRAEYEKGDVCEFDWGDIKLKIEGKIRILQMAVFTSAYSNYRYSILMPKQDTECFLEAHGRFFDSISNSYQTLVYDNMKTAVKNFVGLHEKEPTEALLKLSVYYGFKFRFCNIRAGNEKGHVERSVDFVRHKAFSFKTEFDSLEQANAYLNEVCTRLNNIPQKLKDNKTAAQMLEEERAYLLAPMPIYDAAKIVEPRVDKYSTVMIGSCHYSVPDNNVGKKVVAKIYSDLIQCFIDEKLIAQHQRLHGFNQWSLKIEHYLKTLKRKPGALQSSTAMRQADPRLQKIYQTHFIKKEKDFIELLLLIPQKSITDIEAAVSVIKRLSPADISIDKIKLILERDNQKHGKRDSYCLCVTENNYSNTQKIEEVSRQQLIAFKELMPYSENGFIEGGEVV